MGADVSEAELPLEDYPSLGEFFCRKLRDGARPIDMTPGVIISPCDGAIAARGVATDGELLQVKGKTYKLDELLVDEAYAQRFVGGDYVTIYLSPRDYHRVHAPVAAEITAYDYVPGTLFPVNAAATARVDRLLARNERVVLRLDAGKAGHIAFVMVGAAGVGNMRVEDFDSASLRSSRELRHIQLSDRRVQRGDELGAFRLGSTVVMVFEPGKAILAGDLGQAVKFGERLGNLA